MFDRFNFGGAKLTTKLSTSIPYQLFQLYSIYIKWHNAQIYTLLSNSICTCIDIYYLYT